MGYLSNYAENKILDHVLKNTAFTRPSHLFLGVCTGDPTDTGTGGTISEPSSGNGYARVVCDSWNSAASRATSINTVITFPTATGNWGNLSHFAILDTSVLSTGNIIAYGAISPAKTILSGDTAAIDSGDLDISVNSGGASDFLANALLDHLFKNTAFSQPANIYIGLSTATIDDNDTGSTITEPGENYARKLHNNWKVASAGASSNSGAVLFDKTTGGTWGTITYYALLNSLTTGQVLLYSSVSTSKVIEVADIATFNDGEISVTAD